MPILNCISLFLAHSSLSSNFLNSNTNVLNIPQGFRSLQMYLFNKYYQSAFHVLVTMVGSGVTEMKKTKLNFI